MPTFRYKAMNDRGHIHRGRLLASDVEALDAQLRQRRLDLITATPMRAPLLQRFRNAIGRRELINFCFQLEQLIAAGVPLLQALADVRETLEHGAFAEILADVVDRIMEGKSFSAALALHPRVFDAVFVNLVRAGELSGQLPAVLHELADTLKWQDEWAARTRKAMLYPAFVGAVVAAVTTFLMIHLVPQLVRFITGMGGTLPTHTRALLWLSDRFVNGWVWMLSVPLLAYVVLRVALRHEPQLRLRLDEYKLRVWILGEVVRKLTLSRLARLFALLYRSGMPVLDILQIAGDLVGNRAIAKAIDAAREEIAQGANIARAFERSALFPPLVLRMIHMGETTGALDQAMGNVSYFFDRDVKERADRLEAMLEPAMTLVLGTLLGWIMLAVLGPVYDLVSRITP